MTSEETNSQFHYLRNICIESQWYRKLSCSLKTMITKHFTFLLSAVVSTINKKFIILTGNLLR